MAGASLQAPLSGLALVLELTHSGFGLMVPMIAATAIATIVAFDVDGYSIPPAFTPDKARPDSRTDHQRAGTGESPAGTSFGPCVKGNPEGGGR